MNIYSFLAPLHLFYSKCCHFISNFKCNNRLLNHFMFIYLCYRFQCSNKRTCNLKFNISWNFSAFVLVKLRLEFKLNVVFLLCPLLIDMKSDAIQDHILFTGTCLNFPWWKYVIIKRNFPLNWRSFRILFVNWIQITQRKTNRKNKLCW